nr:hypothetical protein [Tanacetum cinerariifolium]
MLFGLMKVDAVNLMLLELQKQLDEREDDIDWSVVAEQVKERQSESIKIYQDLKKKPVSVAQARKNMMIYLKNMAGYKMEFFKGMTYDEIRPIYEREYNKVQTLFKQDKDVQKTNKKRVADETLLQESFKKLRAAEVSKSESTQEIPTNDPKEITKDDVQNMLEIVPVPEFKVEALQVKYHIIDWEIHIEGPIKYWKIIRVGERFSSTEPIEDKERALWVELKRLFEPDANDKKITLLSNAVMILMLSGKLQVEEDNEMAKDLVMKIFMEANRRRNKSV